jgi:hypothetical protein
MGDLEATLARKSATSNDLSDLHIARIVEPIENVAPVISGIEQFKEWN